MDTLNKITFFICLVATIAFASLIESCSNSGDKSVHDEIIELEMRIEKLGYWSERANSQITALQGLIHALEQNDHITDVTSIMKGSKEVGYTIFFNDRDPIYIYNGEDGKDDLVPIIGVEKGDDRTNPTINVAAYEGANTNFTGKLCWKVNGEFLLVEGNPVIAAGVNGSPSATGDAIFKENGIVTDRANGTVTFTLADGTSTITLPLLAS